MVLRHILSHAHILECPRTEVANPCEHDAVVRLIHRQPRADGDGPRQRLHIPPEGLPRDPVQPLHRRCTLGAVTVSVDENLGL